MHKLQSEFTGMMLTLKKRMGCIKEDDINDYQYLMFGHYDGMDLVCTNQWYCLRPKGVEVNGGNVDINDSFLDKYTLKLYFPSQKQCEKLEKEGFSYEIWKMLGNYRKKGTGKGQCEDLLEQFPFISVAMINLSKKCVEKENDLLAKMQTVIIDAVRQNGVNMADIHCAIMPSIGYADFVLLFLSNHLKKVIGLLDCLKNAFVMDHGKAYAVLSNSYAISGFAKEGLRGLQDKKNLKDVKLSIRVNLRDWISAFQFKKFFEKEIGKILQIKGESDKKNPYELYQLLGNSDCLILSDMPFDFFVPLFYDKNLLNPAHELFQTYIQHTRSSIRIEIDTREKETIIEGNEEESYVRYQKKFQSLIEKLKHYVKCYNMPIRTINGLQTVMKTYLNLVRFSHCFDIEKVIGDAFEALENNVEKTICLVEENVEYADWYSEQMMRALKMFREKIEDYLVDLCRSDRLFIEGQALSHPSIGSATKLLFFYNKYINDMAERLLNTDMNSRQVRYTFVVTSGGCDLTTSYDLFSYIDPAESLTHSLIVILIPEMSLYDFRGTMFRLLHECFHFCGERKREARLEAFLKNLSANVAVVISKGLGASFENQFSNRICHSIEKYFSGEKLKAVKKHGKEIVEAHIYTLRQKLTDEIYKRIEKNFNKDSYSAYYGRNMYLDVMQILKDDVLLSDEITDRTSLLHYVYCESVLCQIELVNELLSYLLSENITFSSANIWKETAEYKKEIAEEGRFDSGEVKLIHAIFRNLAENTAFEKDIVSIGEEDRITVDELVSNLQSLLKECFADYMAAAILQLPVEDFILCFLYETWKLENAFPDSLRIAIGLRALYDIRGKFDKSIRQKINKKVSHWKDLGFNYERYDHYIDKVCDQLDIWLEEFNQSETSGYVGMNFIVEYLQQCQDFYREQSFETLTDISRLSDMASSEDVYKLLGKVHNVWKNITEDGRDCISNEAKWNS